MTKDESRVFDISARRKVIDGSSESSAPEVALWGAVIEQAVLDLRRLEDGVPKKQDERGEIRNALRFLLSHSPDWRDARIMVCRAAGFDYSEVHEGAKRELGRLNISYDDAISRLA